MEGADSPTNVGHSQTFPRQAIQQEKAFPATEEAMKVQLSALILRM